MVLWVRETVPRLRHSPLLEVNNTGSLLIVKSHSSNPPNEARSVPSGSPAAATKIPTHADFVPFVPPVSTSAYSFSTEPATQTSLFAFQIFFFSSSGSFLLLLLPFTTFLLPSASPNVSLSHSLSVPQTACLDRCAAFKDNRN